MRHRTSAYKPTRSPASVWTRRGAAPPAETIADPPARLLEELAAVGGHGRRVAGAQDVRDYVRALARERAATSLLRWDDPFLERLALDDALAAEGVEVVVWRELDDFRDVAGRADIGLSAPAWGIAETGSIALESGPGRGRVVTLLPPCHVSVLPAERVLPTVADVIGHYARAGAALPSGLAFHTGPSRTGDIEQTLATGVHGPGDVHVLLVG